MNERRQIPRVCPAGGADAALAAVLQAGCVLIERAAPELARLAFIEMESHFAAGHPPAREAARCEDAAARSEGVARLSADPFIACLRNGMLGALADSSALDIAEVHAAAPGAAAGPLVRAEEALGIPPSDFITGIHVLWTLSPAERNQGAPELAPGSHRWPRDRAAREEELHCAPMAPGDALVFLGSTLRRVGANLSDTPCLYALLGYGLGIADIVQRPDPAARPAAAPLRVAANANAPSAASLAARSK